MFTINFKPLHLTISLSYLHCTSYLLNAVTISVPHICRISCSTRLQSLTTYASCVWLCNKESPSNSQHISMPFCATALFAHIILDFRVHQAVIQRCFGEVLCPVSAAPYPCICMRHHSAISHSSFRSVLKQQDTHQPLQINDILHFGDVPQMQILLLGISLVSRASRSTWAPSSALCWGRHRPPSCFTFRLQEAL